MTRPTLLRRRRRRRARSRADRLCRIADAARSSLASVDFEALLDAERNVVLITGDHPITARAPPPAGLPADASVVTWCRTCRPWTRRRTHKLAADMQVLLGQPGTKRFRLRRRCSAAASDRDGRRRRQRRGYPDGRRGHRSERARGSSAARGAADIVLTDDTWACAGRRSMWAGVRRGGRFLVGGNVVVLFTVIGTAFGAVGGPVNSSTAGERSPTCFRAAVAATRSLPEPFRRRRIPNRMTRPSERSAEHRRVVLIGRPAGRAYGCNRSGNRGVVTRRRRNGSLGHRALTRKPNDASATMGLTAL